MCKKRFSDKWIWFLIITIFFLLFFLMNHFTPYLADDFLYTHHFQWGSDQKITSFSDFVSSAGNYYLQWSGRIYGYCLGIFSYYCSPFLFDIINTLIYLCMVFFVYRIINSGRPGNWILYLFLHLAIWILVPDYGQVMFWQSGSIAYLWASLPTLAVLWLFRKNSIAEQGFMKSWYAAIPMFFLGGLAGVAMENISAGLLVILTLSLVYFYRKKKLHPAYIACYLGALSGFLALILAPGNQRRAESGESLSLLFKFFILDYYWIWIFGAASIAWIILVYHEYKKRKVWSEKAITSLIYMAGAFCSAYCLLAAPSIPERSLYISALFLIIAVSILAVDWAESHRTKIQRSLCIICTGAMVWFFVSICDTLICSREIYIQTNERNTYILEQKEKGIRKVSVPIISVSYPFRSRHHALEGLSDISQDPDFWINAGLAQHYGIEELRGFFKE